MHVLAARLVNRGQAWFAMLGFRRRRGRYPPKLVRSLGWIDLVGGVSNIYTNLYNKHMKTLCTHCMMRGRDPNVRPLPLVSSQASTTTAQAAIMFQSRRLPIPVDHSGKGQCSLLHTGSVISGSRGTAARCFPRPIGDAAIQSKASLAHDEPTKSTRSGTRSSGIVWCGTGAPGPTRPRHAG